MTIVARLDTGESRPAAQPFELAEAIVAAQSGLGLPTEPGRGRIVTRGVAGTVLADAASTAAVLRGVLIYAAKFCEHGDIEVTAEEGDGRIVLALTFAGQHGETALADMAFVELPPAENPGARPRVGLGPALIARVVGHMGGDLALDEAGDGRARVALTLPAAEQPALR